MAEDSEVEEHAKGGADVDTSWRAYDNKYLSSTHMHLNRLLLLPNKSITQYIFYTVAALCDPFTQPEEDEDNCLSLDFLSSIFIASTYHKMLQNVTNLLDVPANELEMESIKLALALEFFNILEHIDLALNSKDELELRYTVLPSYHSWTPNEEIRDDEAALKLLYSIACVLVMSLYKLFQPAEGSYNLITNPFLNYFITSWKCHTNIILSGLEIDRRTEISQQSATDEQNIPDENEQDEVVETPQFVKWVLQGSSAIRHVLAWILNQNPSSVYEEEEMLGEPSSINDYDMKEESLLGFIQPLARKKVNGGALLLDMRLVMIGLLILNSGISCTSSSHVSSHSSREPSEEEINRAKKKSKPIAELGDILIDLEYDDRFDEDIRYIFELEYQDSDDEWSNSEEEVEKVQISPSGSKESPNEEAVSTAIRSDENDIEFDEYGRDWRDLPRGQNIEFEPYFLELVNDFESGKDGDDSKYFFSSWKELEETFDYIVLNNLEDNVEAEKLVGQALLNTISKSIKDEMDNKESDMTPDKIYKILSSPASDSDVSSSKTHSKLIVPIFTVTKFEVLLHNNSKLARCIIDELLMCRGYRRVIFWFLTHNINLSTLLIDFVFELITGLRGDFKRSEPYKLTRKGNKIILSDVEQSMLIHEFLSNSSIYLSAADGIEIDEGYTVVLAESVAKKYMELLCLMINQLINKGIISLQKDEKDDRIHDYTNELKVLLVNWVGKLPAARELFFRITNNHSNKVNSEITGQEESLNLDREAEKQLIEEYSNMSTPMISTDLEDDQKHYEVVNNFLKRLSADINYVIENQRKSPTQAFSVSRVSEDFKFFMDNFNTLCKIEYLAESLFERFEDLLSNGLGDNEASKSEFSEQFLNGSGQFSLNVQDPFEESKTKKITT